MDFPTFVYALQIATITGCIFIGGLSSTLSLWITPLCLRLPPHLAAAQFKRTVTWGFQYLQPSSRILAALLLTTTALTSQLASPSEAQKWKSWVLCTCALVSTAPYEIYLIFPINDRVEEIRKRLEKEPKSGEQNQGAYGRELTKLLKMWQARNFGRVIMPVLVGVVGMMNLSTK